MIGATGYIGGSLLASLKTTKPSFKFTAFTRSPASVPILESFSSTGNIKAVLGTSDDHEKIVDLASKADLIIDTGDADDFGLVQALLEGLKRGKKLGKEGTLVHASGTGIYMTENAGKFDPDTKEWTDNDDDNKLINLDMMHGNVDTTIFKAIDEDALDVYIVAPSGVYGVGTGPVSKSSFISKKIVPTFLAKKEAYYVGEGSSTIALIHINDLTNLMTLLVEHALSSKATQTGAKRNPYSRLFIASTFTTSWKSTIDTYARVLYDRGKISSADAKSGTSEDLGGFGFVMASNTRVRPLRAKRELGWEAKGPEFNTSVLGEEIDEVLKNL